MDYEFRDPQALARIVRYALIAYIVATICDAGSSLYTMLTINAFQAGSASQEDLASVDTVTGVTAIPVLLTNLIAFVLVARWIYRVNKNAHALSGGMEMTPGWNVGFFFVPIANLWKPFQGIAQSWRASVSPSDPQAVDVPGWMRLWWGCWLIMNFITNIAFRLSLNAKTLDDFQASSSIELLILPFDLGAAAMLFLLVTRLSQIQHDAGDVEAQQAVFE